MSRSGYVALTEGEVALAAAGTAKTILGVDSPSNFGIDLKSAWIDFDGVNAAEKPVRFQLIVCTFATNPPGTSSTTVTVGRVYGLLGNTGFAAAKNWTAEPTVMGIVVDERSVDSNKGAWHYDFNFGESPDCGLDSGFVIRCLVESGDTVSGLARAGMRFERA